MSDLPGYHIKATLLLALLLIPIAGLSQDDPAVQFAAASRMDFIGLKNYDNKKFGLIHTEADFAISLLSDNLKLFKGGELFIQVMGIAGNKASADYSHDLQVFSNIESENRVFLYQAYYRQSFGRLNVTLGQLDMNSEYSVSGYGSSLINSSFGVIPTISLNMPVSIFSYLTAGVSLRYALTDRLSVQTALFNGHPGDYETNRHNLKWKFSGSTGFFSISEIHLKTRNNLMTGRYKAGIFYHSKTFTGLSEKYSSRGNPGFFLMGDQQLIREKNTIKNGLNMFFVVSLSPSKVNLIGSYYAAGLIYRGIFRGMNEDECTLAIASAHLTENAIMDNPDFLGHETALEFTYKKYITSCIILQPDIQYIINPGAVRSQNGNVTVGMLRTMIIF